MKRPTLLLGALACAGIIVACGGGGSDAPAAAQPPAQAFAAEGIWLSTGTGALILPDGDLWAVDLNNLDMYRGSVTVSGNAFSSPLTLFRDGLPLATGTISGTVAARSTLNGTATASNGTSATFAGTYRTEYDQAPNLAALAGTYTVFQSTATVIVNAQGNLTVGDGGCTGSGTLTPDASGKNFYRASVTFGPAPCDLPGATATGVAVGVPGQILVMLTAPGNVGQAFVLNR